MKNAIKENVQALLWIALLFFVGGTTTVYAHTKLLVNSATPPRIDADNLKSPAPCGGIPRTDKPAIFTQNQTVTIEWVETIDHDGFYTLKIARSDNDIVADNLMLDMQFNNDVSGSEDHDYSESIQMPNESCTDCTLQLIQHMVVGQSVSPYFSCADIAIVDPNDNVAPSNAAGFGGVAVNNQVNLSWVNPNDADFYKVLVVQSSEPISFTPSNQNVFPLGTTVGVNTTVIYNGSGSEVVSDGVTTGAVNYYAAFTYDENYNYQ